MTKFSVWLEDYESLYKKLLILKPKIILAVQKIYNDWNQDEDGLDVVFGGGGICDEISKEISDIIVQNIPNVETTDGGQPGDDHSWVIAFNSKEAYHIDISPNVYEVGSGYRRKKRKNVIFQPNHIEIYQAIPNPYGQLEY